MPMHGDNDYRIEAATACMNWVLAHPGFSTWLKTALSESWGRDPVELLNELEVLDNLIRECIAELSWIPSSEEG